MAAELFNFWFVSWSFAAPRVERKKISALENIVVAYLCLNKLVCVYYSFSTWILKHEDTLAVVLQTNIPSKGNKYFIRFICSTWNLTLLKIVVHLIELLQCIEDKQFLLFTNLMLMLIVIIHHLLYIILLYSCFGIKQIVKLLSSGT